MTFGCYGGGNAAVDYAACERDVAASSCVSGAGGEGVLLPDSFK